MKYSVALTTMVTLLGTCATAFVPCQRIRQHTLLMTAFPEDEFLHEEKKDPSLLPTQFGKKMS